MTLTTPQTQRPPVAVRILYAIPILGQIARDISRGVDNFFYALMIFATCLTLAVLAWGLPALVLTALALVPVMFCLLISTTIP